MDVHTALLAPHVAAGTLGLALGPLAMVLPKRARHAVVGRLFVGVTVVMTTTALALALMSLPANAHLAVIATATLAACVAGLVVRRRHRPGWLRPHVVLMLSSYLSFTTAFLLTVWDSPLAWVLPTVVGSPLIALTVRRLPAGAPRRRPAPAVA